MKAEGEDPDPERSNAAREEVEPRAIITNAVTGETRPVLKSDLKGLDEWAENWPTDPELPSRVAFSGWQMVDDAHPIGGGRPGYRIVYKTIRTVVFPVVEATAPNLRVSFNNGGITWGEPRFTNALPDRREGEWLVPQWGTLEIKDAIGQYTIEADRNVQLEAHQETTPDCNYVEILYVFLSTETMKFDERMAAGRASVAPLTAALDLQYGERLLGPVLAEELGEVFDDWHWNREIGGGTVAMEGQARLDHLKGEAVVDSLNAIMDLQSRRNDEDRSRTRIASQWYWRADKDADPVLKFLGYWLCIEALLLKENSNIGPVKRTVADILSIDPSLVAPGVGRIYSLRNKLAHGTVRAVPEAMLSDLRAVACAVMELHLIGAVSDERKSDLLAAVIGG